MISPDAPEAVQTLSDEERRALADDIVQRLEDREARRHIADMFAAAQSDPRITGLGATTRTGERPIIVVPRSEFADRAARLNDQTEEPKRRTISREANVTLVRPVLIRAKRRWGFIEPGGKEFGATIEDEGFLEGVMSGENELRMVAGIRMTVELKVDEEFIDGMWHPKEYRVTDVKAVHPPGDPPRELPLRQEPEGDDTDSDDQAGRE